MTSRPSPTYESILDLPVEDIAAADYRSVSDVNCIYVETVQDPEGYTQRYWVSVETGLLVASERLLEEETIYRMAFFLLKNMRYYKINQITTLHPQKYL